LDRITQKFPDAAVTTRDLSKGLPLIDESWMGANYVPAENHNEAQKQALACSNELITELQEADILLLGLPIYNFSVPATFKTWIDQIARIGVTFTYTETGPAGLLSGKRAIVAVASGGTKIGSEMDFSTGYIRCILGFIGITDVTFVAADSMMTDPGAALATAHAQIDAL